MNDQQPATVSMTASSEDEIDLRDLFALLLDEWRWIAGITVVVSGFALVYAMTATPIYRTDAILQIEEKEGGLSGLEDLSTMLAGETPTEAEVEIIRSRKVLLQTIQRERLDITVESDYFPLIGGVMARRFESDPAHEHGIAEAFFGFDSYAWGGEKVRVDRMDVPRAYEGEEMTLVAGDGDRFELRIDDAVLAAGEVGVAAEGNGVSIFVSQLHARPGTAFTVVKSNPLKVLDELRSRLSVAERGKKTGILEIALEGPDPRKIETTLNTITEIYLRQNVERKSAEAAQSLEFLNEQLPELKAELETAEVELNNYRVTQGSVDLSLETQGMLEQLAEVEKKLSELELEKAELTQRFTAEHPAMQALNDQRTELEQSRNRIEVEIRKLPEAEQDALRLMRNVRVANELYMLLLNRAQELKVVRAGTVGNARIVDEPFVPLEPVKPKKSLVAALGLVLGGMFGVFFVFLRQAMNIAIRDPKVLEDDFELPVYAIVPHSETEVALHGNDGESVILANVAPDDLAVESLRSLRTSLEFLFMQDERRVLTVGGPAPEVGKSFVSTNIAVLLAQTGKRVLLVDADMRRGHLHQVMGQERAPGLSELITGTEPAEQVIRDTGTDNLQYIASGRIPPNPAELTVSDRFRSLLDEFAMQFDVVILDAPPLLAAAEAMTLARLSDVNLLVVRSGRLNKGEVRLALDRLRQGGAQTNGFVFNDLEANSRRYADSGYRYYRYEKSEQ